MKTNKFFKGDSLTGMRKLPNESIHALITDPPYGIEFMSLSWYTEFDTAQGDRLFQATGSMGDKGFGTLPAFRGMTETELDDYRKFTVAWSTEALRILKPGGYLLSFGGIKTHDIMTLGFRQAGFQIRDVILWLFASGFPKGQDISKEFDRKAGVERPIIAKSPNVRPAQVTGAAGFHKQLKQHQPERYEGKKGEDFNITAPVTEDAIKWDGWRTNLKTAYEPIVMCQKPREGTFIENVKEYEVGALNIDATRIPFDSKDDVKTVKGGADRFAKSADKTDNEYFGKQLRIQKEKPTSSKQDTFWYRTTTEKRDRNTGLGLETVPTRKGAGDFKSPHPGDHTEEGEWLTKKPRHDYFANPLGRYPSNVIRTTPFNDGYDPLFLIPKPSISEKGIYNTHPTVKPLALMEHLIKLVTREDQIV
ncbi:MAG: site-specific DNA-methyltransferase, partial [Thermodesulfovibrionia bacterium]|nr:site-specific DNA-methyltransferase [Thermodesulfovibrionia bacterium]